MRLLRLSTFSYLEELVLNNTSESDLYIVLTKLTRLKKLVIIEDLYRSFPNILS